MICANCRTTLPDEAIACWKCGAQVAVAVAKSPAKKNAPDLLLVILTFLIASGLFVCMGWAVPFTVWGVITSSASQFPQWASILGVVSGIAFVVSAIAIFGGAAISLSSALPPSRVGVEGREIQLSVISQCH